MSKLNLGLKLNGHPVDGYPRLVDGYPRLVQASSSQSAIHATLEVPLDGALHDEIEDHIWKTSDDPLMTLEGEVLDRKKDAWFKFKIKGNVHKAKISETSTVTFHSAGNPERWDKIEQ